MARRKKEASQLSISMLDELKNDLMDIKGARTLSKTIQDACSLYIDSERRIRTERVRKELEILTSALSGTDSWMVGQLEGEIKALFELTEKKPDKISLAKK